MTGSRRRALAVEARRVAALRGDLLSVAVAGPLPPGSRVDVLLPSSAGEVSGKVVAIRREPDGEVVVDVRLHDLHRERRARIEVLVNSNS